MNVKLPVWLSWSSGKDSAWSFYKLSAVGYKPSAIFTTVNEKYNRVAMHGTRMSILKEQAGRLGVNLKIISLPDICDNVTYQKIMTNFISQEKCVEVKTFAFGDLFLEDIKAYRENQLVKENVEAVFPLWGMNTKQVALEMIDNGLKAIINCIDSQQIPEEFLGREFNRELINDLPDTIDPCGENGEFHTCVYDSPSFSHPLSLIPDVKKVSGQFQFIDLKLN